MGDKRKDARGGDLRGHARKSRMPFVAPMLIFDIDQSAKRTAVRMQAHTSLSHN
jgi:hypothetical protein